MAAAPRILDLNSVITNDDVLDKSSHLWCFNIHGQSLYIANTPAFTHGLPLYRFLRQHAPICIGGLPFVGVGRRVATMFPVFLFFLLVSACSVFSVHLCVRLVTGVAGTRQFFVRALAELALRMKDAADLGFLFVHVFVVNHIVGPPHSWLLFGALRLCRTAVGGWSNSTQM